MTNNQSQLLETTLTQMNNKTSTEIEVSKNHSFQDCEAVRYKLWNEYKVEITEENKKLRLLVWRK